MIRDDERLVLSAFRGSVAGRLLRSITAAMTSATATRRVSRMIAFAQRHAPAAIRVTGCIVAAACLTHAMLIRLWPESTVGRVPIATSAIASLIGLCAAVVPNAIAVAWRDSAIRRAYAHLSRKSH